MAAVTRVCEEPFTTLRNPDGPGKFNISVQVEELPTSQPSSPPSSPDPPADDQTVLKDDFDLLISSPYTEAEHRLRLSTLDVQSSLLARALQHLEAVTPDYAILPYTEGLNWEQVLSNLRELSEREDHSWTSQSFYVVAFFSRLKPDIDREHLGKLDKDSHAEAAISGGLLKYWFGSPSADRRNLATCVWRSHEDAIAGGKGPGHANAMRATRSLYERIDFKTMSLTIEDGAVSLRLDSLGEKTFDYSA